MRKGKIRQFLSDREISNLLDKSMEKFYLNPPPADTSSDLEGEEKNEEEEKGREDTEQLPAAIRSLGVNRVRVVRNKYGVVEDRNALLDDDRDGLLDGDKDVGDSIDSNFTITLNYVSGTELRARVE